MAMRRIIVAGQPRQLLFFGQTRAFVDTLSDRQRCDPRANEYTALGARTHKRGHWAEYSPLADDDGARGHLSVQ